MRVFHHMNIVLHFPRLARVFFLLSQDIQVLERILQLPHNYSGISQIHVVEGNQNQAE